MGRQRGSQRPPDNAWEDEQPLSLPRIGAPPRKRRVPSPDYSKLPLIPDDPVESVDDPDEAEEEFDESDRLTPTNPRQPMYPISRQHAASSRGQRGASFESALDEAYSQAPHSRNEAIAHHLRDPWTSMSARGLDPYATRQQSLAPHHAAQMQQGWGFGRAEALADRLDHSAVSSMSMKRKASQTLPQDPAKRTQLDFQQSGHHSSTSSPLGAPEDGHRRTHGPPGMGSTLLHRHEPRRVSPNEQAYPAAFPRPSGFERAPWGQDGTYHDRYQSHSPAVLLSPPTLPSQMDRRHPSTLPRFSPAGKAANYPSNPYQVAHSTPPPMDRAVDFGARMMPPPHLGRRPQIVNGPFLQSPTGSDLSGSFRGPGPNTIAPFAPMMPPMQTAYRPSQSPSQNFRRFEELEPYLQRFIDPLQLDGIRQKLMEDPESVADFLTKMEEARRTSIAPTRRAASRGHSERQQAAIPTPPPALRHPAPRSSQQAPLRSILRKPEPLREAYTPSAEPEDDAAKDDDEPTSESFLGIEPSNAFGLGSSGRSSGSPKQTATSAKTGASGEVNQGQKQGRQPGSDVQRESNASRHAPTTPTKAAPPDIHDGDIDRGDMGKGQHHETSKAAGRSKGSKRPPSPCKPKEKSARAFDDPDDENDENGKDQSARLGMTTGQASSEPRKHSSTGAGQNQQAPPGQQDPSGNHHTSATSSQPIPLGAAVFQDPHKRSHSSIMARITDDREDDNAADNEGDEVIMQDESSSGWLVAKKAKEEVERKVREERLKKHRSASKKREPLETPNREAMESGGDASKPPDSSKGTTPVTHFGQAAPVAIMQTPVLDVHIKRKAAPTVPISARPTLGQPAGSRAKVHAAVSHPPRASTADNVDVRSESERKEAERREAERKEAERKEAERQEAERKEAERKEAEGKEAERKEAIPSEDQVLIDLYKRQLSKRDMHGLWQHRTDTRITIEGFRSRCKAVEEKYNLKPAADSETIPGDLPDKWDDFSELDKQLLQTRDSTKNARLSWREFYPEWVAQSQDMRGPHALHETYKALKAKLLKAGDARGEPTGRDKSRHKKKSGAAGATSHHDSWGDESSARSVVLVEDDDEHLDRSAALNRARSHGPEVQRDSPLIPIYEPPAGNTRPTTAGKSINQQTLEHWYESENDEFEAIDDEDKCHYVYWVERRKMHRGRVDDDEWKVVSEETLDRAQANQWVGRFFEDRTEKLSSDDSWSATDGMRTDTGGEYLRERRGTTDQQEVIYRVGRKLHDFTHNVLPNSQAGLERSRTIWQVLFAETGYEYVLVEKDGPEDTSAYDFDINGDDAPWPPVDETPDAERASPESDSSSSSSSSSSATTLPPARIDGAATHDEEAKQTEALPADETRGTDPALEPAAPTDHSAETVNPLGAHPSTTRAPSPPTVRIRRPTPFPFASRLAHLSAPLTALLAHPDVFTQLPLANRAALAAFKKLQHGALGRPRRLDAVAAEARGFERVLDGLDEAGAPFQGAFDVEGEGGEGGVVVRVWVERGRLRGARNG